MNIFDKFKKKEKDYQIPPFVGECDYQELCNPKQFIQQIQSQIKTENNDITIFVQFSDEFSFGQQVIVCKESETVEGLYTLIKKKFQIGRIELIYNGKFIKRYNQTLKQISIKNHSTVSVIYAGNQVQLSYGNRNLDPKLTLNEQNIPDWANIDLKIFCVGGCFPSNTMIQMMNGLLKPIDQIKVGDEIQTFNQEKNEIKSSIVTGTYIGIAERFIKLTTHQGNIICTPNHKLLTKDGWKSVQNHPCDNQASLTEDDLLIHYQFGPVEIIKIEYNQGKKELIYDLSVEHDHNFIAGGFVVHNALIYIQTKDQTHEIEIDSEYETLHSLQLKIQMKLKIPIKKQKLSYNGRNVTNSDLNIKDIECNKGATINLDAITLDLEIVEEQPQSIIQQEINPGMISFFLKTLTKREYPIQLERDLTFKNIKYIFKILENIETIDQTLCLYNGKIFTEEEENQTIDIIKPFSTVILIDSKYGISGILLYQNLIDLQIKGIEELKKSLSFIKQSKLKKLNEFIDLYLKESIPNKKDQSIFQKCPIEYILAIAIWTSHLVYKQINQDICKNTFSKWYQYLKFLSAGLKNCPYYRGDVYRGIKDYQNFNEYQPGKDIFWTQVSALSKSRKVSEDFTNNKGTLFQVSVVGAKDISNVSIFSYEEEVLFMPFSCFYVDNVIQNNNSFTFVKLKEIPIPRTTSIILWVDDQPKNNYDLISEVEIEFPEISIVICTSTEEALNFFKIFRWIHLLDHSRFRVITDMARSENGQMNYCAGVDLLQYLHNELKYSGESMIYCYDTKKAQLNCQERGIKGNYRIEDAIQQAKQFVSFK